MTKVVHCKKESYDIYIGRPSKWGNPYSIGKDGSREDVIKKYKKYILSNKKLLNSLCELQGKVLGCWCKPKECHGDVLVRLINERRQKKMKRVIIESPYAGDIPMNEIYGELCMNDCLVNHNESPYASHLLYTRTWVLRDDHPEERKLGIDAGFYWREVAEQSNFYVDLGLTDGMKLGMKDCAEKLKPFAARHLPNDLWERFLEICKSEGLYPPERSEYLRKYFEVKENSE